MEPDCQSLDLHQHPNQNTHQKANVEPESQSLDLHRHPNQNTRKKITSKRRPIAGLTSASEPNKPTLETRCHLMDLYRTPSTQQEDTECQSLGLHPSPNTHKTKQKGRPERSAHLLPTYLIWYEDQGDVVPLRRDTGLA